MQILDVEIELTLVLPMKTQREVWEAVPSALESLKEQKNKLNEWKERFGQEVITKAIGTGDALTSYDTAFILLGVSSADCEFFFFLHFPVKSRKGQSK